MLKAFFITIGALAILAIGFAALNIYIYSEKQEPQAIASYRGVLAGEYVCLPHKDVSGVQTDECAFGMKTEAGEFYAVDMNLLSQNVPQMTIGDKFQATGVITPIEMLSSDHWQKYNVKGIFSITDSFEKTATSSAYACNGDAKLCPDGTTVGRVGPQCVFASCPSPDRPSAEITTFIGGEQTAIFVSVSPREIVSDSRCSKEVQCVWAGTVEVRTVLSTKVAHGEHVMKLNEPQKFGEYTVTLIAVTPEKGEDEIPESTYRFTYRIER